MLFVVITLIFTLDIILYLLSKLVLDMGMTTVALKRKTAWECFMIWLVGKVLLKRRGDQSTQTAKRTLIPDSRHIFAKFQLSNTKTQNDCINSCKWFYFVVFCY